MNNVLSDRQLKRLAEHKYSAECVSILDPYFQVFWRWLVEQLPLSLAPNTITVSGLAINAPWWAFVLNAVGLFVYQSLDAVDGKQARRTNSASPLGELVDHGCDSVSIVCMVLSTNIAVQLGTEPWWMFFISFMATFIFYCAHWQAYVSGTLRFGKIDVTEIQLAGIIIFFMSAIFGGKVWSSQGTSVLSPLFPIAFMLYLAYLTARTSSTSIFQKHTCLFVMAFGLACSKITIKLVCYVLFDQIRFNFALGNEICNYFNISYFRITPRPPVKPIEKDH
ncbi:Cholinephosphotransferase 1 [Acropora cervicornis]|uniref:Cholinephosphotransferase 1 n=1 Tax=Acropora cervicornis TaxID=6130 RepID=A0AAD9VCU1_ACRCE|nr:Cholinephosphotransferase 1 [Acropora cervicornis]